VIPFTKNYEVNFTKNKKRVNESMSAKDIKNGNGDINIRED
jgi:hypothetical protein